MAATDANERVEYRDGYVDRVSLTRAVLAGVVGGIAFGFLIQFVVGRMGAIGALYTLGTPNVVVGWIAHLFHSALFGAVFGFATEYDPMHRWMERSIALAAVLGIAFAMVLYVVNIGFVWPTWLTAVGYAPIPDLAAPYFPVRPLLGHLAYGVILGTVHRTLVDY